MEKTFLLPESVLKGLLNYLATRPWAEVNEGIVSLSKLQEQPAPVADEAK